VDFSYLSQPKTNTNSTFHRSSTNSSNSSDCRLLDYFVNRRQIRLPHFWIYSLVLELDQIWNQTGGRIISEYKPLYLLRKNDHPGHDLCWGTFIRLPIGIEWIEGNQSRPNAAITLYERQQAPKISHSLPVSDLETSQMKGPHAKATCCI
jgi:hypothetical protein